MKRMLREHLPGRSASSEDRFLPHLPHIGGDGLRSMVDSFGGLVLEELPDRFHTQFFFDGILHLFFQLLRRFSYNGARYSHSVCLSLDLLVSALEYSDCFVDSGLESFFAQYKMAVFSFW